MFAGGTLTPADKCYDGVEKGISDIGMSVLGYTRGRFPLSEVIDLPLGYRSGAAATELVNAFYGKFQPKEFDSVKIMYFHAHGPGFLHTKKPVAKLEDLKGMKIRCTGLAAKIVTALGGIPVAMPMARLWKWRHSALPWRREGLPHKKAASSHAAAPIRSSTRSR